MKKTFLALVAAAAIAAPAHAQLPNLTPFSFEVRGGLAVPRGDFADTGGSGGDIVLGIDPGYTVGANATFHVIPLLGIYGGYTYSRFPVESSDMDLVDHGFDAGVRVAVPTPLIPIDPYVKAGLVYHSAGFRLELNGEEVDTDGDRSLGWEAGAGVGIGLGPKLSFTPQVTYTRYEAAELNGTGRDVNVEHLRLGVGLRLRL